MNLGELVKLRKEELEKKIEELVKKFEADTGLRVGNIYVSDVKELTTNKIIKKILEVRLDI